MEKYIVVSYYKQRGKGIISDEHPIEFDNFKEAHDFMERKHEQYLYDYAAMNAGYNGIAVIDAFTKLTQSAKNK